MKTNLRQLSRVVLAALCFGLSQGAAATGVLENPPAGSVESGITAITGWHCTSRNIEIRVDGVPLGTAGAGTLRPDTAGVCGRTDTGFSFLFNYGRLAPGNHRMDVYADGAVFASVSFRSTYLGGEFLTGLSSAHRIPDFPALNQSARVQWSQSKQNYVITEIAPSSSGSIVGTYSMRHTYLLDSNGMVFSTMQPGMRVSGSGLFRSDGSYSMSFTLSVNGQSQSSSAGGTWVDHGHYITENGSAVDLILERGETLTLFTFVNQGTSSAAVVLSMVKAGTTSKDDGGDLDTMPIATGNFGDQVLRALTR